METQEINFAYCLGKYTAYTMYYPHIKINDPTVLKTLEHFEWTKDTFNKEEVQKVLVNSDEFFKRQYILGFLDTTPVMDYPYDIFGLTLPESEEDFLQFVFGTNLVPQQILFYYNRFVDYTNNYLKVKKLSSDAYISTEQTSQQYPTVDIYITKKIKEVNGVEFYGTDLALQAPPGYYLELIPHQKILDIGYLLFNNPNILKSSLEEEVIISLISVSEDSPEIEFPFPVCRAILRKYHSMKIYETN